MKRFSILKSISIALILLIGLSNQKGKKYYYSEDYIPPASDNSAASFSAAPTEAVVPTLKEIPLELSQTGNTEPVYEKTIPTNSQNNKNNNFVAPPAPVKQKQVDKPSDTTSTDYNSDQLEFAVQICLLILVCILIVSAFIGLIYFAYKMIFSKKESYAQFDDAIAAPKETEEEKSKPVIPLQDIMESDEESSQVKKDQENIGGKKVSIDSTGGRSTISSQHQEQQGKLFKAIICLQKRHMRMPNLEEQFEN